jgi:hypothetical protein
MAVLRHGGARLLEVLAQAGGGPACPRDLGEGAGLGAHEQDSPVELRQALGVTIIDVVGVPGHPSIGAPTAVRSSSG